MSEVKVSEIVRKEILKEVKVTNECWDWQGKVNPQGYGLYKIDNRQATCHRIFYSIHFGEIPEGYQVRHTCSNNSCVNPDHLYLFKLKFSFPRSATIADRFWSLISKSDKGCWEWQGSKEGGGYGVLRMKKGRFAAHRLSYELNKGVIPAGLEVCHTCDNPICVNPDHLFLGTSLENAHDMISKGRHMKESITHCPKGHEYTAENTRWKKGIHRICRTCSKARDKVRNERVKAGKLKI